MIKYLEPLERGNRCRKWKLVAGRDKAHRKTEVFRGSKREAEAALDEFAARIANQRVIDRSEATIASYEKEWVDRLRKVGSLDSQTIDGYEWKMKAIGHVIGMVKLQSLTTRDVNRCYAALRGGESPSGKPLSGTYVRDCHMVLCKMLDDAVADGVVYENVARLATPPKRDTKEKHALSDMEMRLLIAMLPTDTASSVAVILAVTTGLRRGELCALRWEDVDMENGVLEVARAARTDGSIKDTKTKAGRRVVPMPSATVHALTEWKACSSESDWVLCKPDGSPIKPNAIGHWWEKHRNEYACDGVTLHELRHTYITSLARAGVHPKVMQELAGHSSVDVSMQIYSHLSLEDKRAAVASLNL